ncbi:hypothetical protein C6Y14_43010 [Streptomyces dioscori]|uniref:Uncharacterized protein n=1 Tax=Streptomyces dioscori TaxID=2109333 RepID=A0A2P8PTE9_9ACTN|nr:hypothetical protein C6Y14_43010 [Streptomyces dioscori]
MERRDVIAAVGGVLLVTAAAIVGVIVQHSTGAIHLKWPPLYAEWRPLMELGLDTDRTVQVPPAEEGTAEQREGGTAWMHTTSSTSGQRGGQHPRPHSTVSRA